MRFYNISMINVYAPTEDKDDNLKDEFYNKLERVLDALPSNDVKIILGDLNAKVGKQEEFRSIVGRHSLHDISNDNGRRREKHDYRFNTVLTQTDMEVARWKNN